MLPIKRILCPTDFSDFSIDALEKAGGLAANFDAELLILHVTQTVEPVYGFAPYSGATTNVESLRRAVYEGAQRELEELSGRSEFADLRTRTLVREGHPPKQIVEAAQFEKADLIVISTHGLTGWRHLIFGSVAENVVRTATCPVLVMPSRKPDEQTGADH